MQADDDRSLKTISRENPDINACLTEMEKLSSSDNRISDRALAIVGGAIIEHALKSAITQKFIELSAADRKSIFSYEGSGPLSNLGSCILIGYALGLYGPETRGDLGSINEIRNGFAHSIEDVHFELPGVRRLCDKIQIVKSGKLMSFRETPVGKAAYAIAVAFYDFRFRVNIQSASGSAIKLAPPTLP